MRYDEWINGIFNREQLNQFDLDWDEDWIQKLYSLSASEILGLIAETFARAGEDLRQFSEVQIALGLYFITSSGEDWLRQIYEEDASTSQRLAVINNIYILYRDCLALRCGNDPTLESTTPLDMYADMFGDASALSIYGILKSSIDDKEELIDAILNVWENTLKISNATCQRAAIHALGHEQFNVRVYHPNHERRAELLRRIEEIIYRYCVLSTTHENLREYALQARTGMIL
jgi:hypothetical protein